MDELLRTFLALLGGGVLVAVVQGLWNRRKLAADTDLAKAETADRLVGTAERLVDSLDQRLLLAEQEISELRSRVRWLEEKASAEGLDLSDRPW